MCKVLLGATYPAACQVIAEFALYHPCPWNVPSMLFIQSISIVCAYWPPMLQPELHVNISDTRLLMPHFGILDALTDSALAELVPGNRGTPNSKSVRNGCTIIRGRPMMMAILTISG